MPAVFVQRQTCAATAEQSKPEENTPRAPLTAFEEQRAANIARNKQCLSQLMGGVALPDTPIALPNAAVQESKSCLLTEGLAQPNPGRQGESETPSPTQASCHKRRECDVPARGSPSRGEQTTEPVNPSHGPNKPGPKKRARAVGKYRTRQSAAAKPVVS